MKRKRKEECRGEREDEQQKKIKLTKKTNNKIKARIMERKKEQLKNKNGVTFKYR